MRAIVYDRGGGPDVLRLVDKPVPGPGAGEVRVLVVRSGVNPADWKTRSRARLASVPARCRARSSWSRAARARSATPRSSWPAGRAARSSPR